MRRLVFIACLAGLLVPVMAQSGQGARVSGNTMVALDAGAINSGVVRSSNANCVKDRTVTVRYRDGDGKRHFLGKDKTNARGEFVAIGGNPKGPFPYKVQAAVAPATRESVRCSGVTSRVRLFHPA